VRGRRRVEGKDFEAGGEALDLVAVLNRAGRFFGAVVELVEGDGGDRERVGLGVEALA
jgi:hypothetical protein